MISEKAFRKYDIRAIIEQELPISEVYKLGKAICTFLILKDKNLKSIAVGMDVRIHSKAIKEELCRAIIDSGLNAIFIGECPTPTLYYATKILKVEAGIMITASHNDKEYNGLKILLNGDSVWDQDIQEIKKIYFSSLDTSTPSTLEMNGVDYFAENKAPATHSEYFAEREVTATHPECFAESKMYRRMHENLLLNNYIEYLCSQFEHIKNRTINMIIDCGNGAAALVIPELVKKMNWQNAQLLFAEVDGNFPNHEPDPTNENNLAELKKIIINYSNPSTSSGRAERELSAAFTPEKFEGSGQAVNYGLALDGDCDRLVVVNSDGKMVPGDKLLTLFAINLKNKGNIVFDIKCSNNVSKILTSTGHTPNICATGHANIKETMKKTDALLGGELSGHFCFTDRYFGYDDAIYALMRFIEIATTQKDLFSFWPEQVNSPEFRIKCATVEPQKVVELARKNLAAQNIKITNIDGVRIETETGWAILRASNTEPVLSIRFEADNEKELNNLKKILYDAISLQNEHLDMLKLKSEIGLRTD